MQLNKQLEALLLPLQGQLSSQTNETSNNESNKFCGHGGSIYLGAKNLTLWFRNFALD